MIKPIENQIDFRNLTNTQKFLAWFPIIGPQAIAIRAVKQGLKRRPEFHTETWRDYKNLEYIIRFSRKLSKANEWLNYYFHPKDPLDYLFLFTDGDGWEVIELMDEWENLNGNRFPFLKHQEYGALFKRRPNEQRHAIRGR